MRVHPSLLRKDSSTHMHILAVDMKERLALACGLSLENSADSYLCFRMALLHSIDHLLHLCARFLIVFHLTKMKFSRSSHLQMCLSLETLMMSFVIISNDLKSDG